MRHVAPYEHHGAADRKSEPLAVLVNAVSARRGGGAVFLLEQLRALEQTGDLRLTIITTASASTAMQRHCARSKLIVWPTLPLPLRILREHATIPRHASSHSVLYVPGNFAIARSRTPQVLVLQSLWHFGHEGRAMRSRCSTRMRTRLAVESHASRASIGRAARVICVSNTMRLAVAEDIGSDEKLSVIATAPPRLPLPSSQRIACGPYVLCVGTDLPHKDWDSVVEAFRARLDLPPLLLVGSCSAPRRRELVARSPDGRVRLLGAVTDRRMLANLYRNASCVLAHSHLESYGLTAVEALSVGAPVAASDIPAHREFCGGAAHYYPPSDREGMLSAVQRAMGDKAAPTAPALSLTWAENAQMTARVLAAAAASTHAATV